MVFSSHTELLQNFTTDRILAADAIAKASAMESKDGTFIHESMFEAVQQAMQATTPRSRRVTIWLTDGTANFENSMTRKTIGKEAPARLHSKRRPPRNYFTPAWWFPRLLIARLRWISPSSPQTPILWR